MTAGEASRDYSHTVFLYNFLFALLCVLLSTSGLMNMNLTSGLIAKFATEFKRVLSRNLGRSAEK